MAHEHHHTELHKNYDRAFGIGIALNSIYIVVELVYGLLISSMALVADAGHNLGDVLGLALAWGAAHLAQSAISKTKTYGLGKSTILAALLNGILLFIAVGAIAVEAVQKLLAPQPVAGNVVMIVAGVGVLINAFTALLFVRDRSHDINIKGAFLHMAADAGVSLGVVFGGLLIRLTNWHIIDPIISLVIVLVIALGAWELLRESFHLSMDAVPKNIDFEQVKGFLQSVEGIEEVHDLHIWPMSTTETALTVHLVVSPRANIDALIKHIADESQQKFHIGHVTIQPEWDQHGDCKQKFAHAL